MPETPASILKNSHTQSALSAPKRNSHHLYQRGTIYYFRYVIPKKMRGRLGQAEIRISLRTGFRQQARKLSRHLWSCLEDEIMPDRERTLAELKEFLNRKFEEKYNDLLPGVFEGKPMTTLNNPKVLQLCQSNAGEENSTESLDKCSTLASCKQYIAREIERQFPGFTERKGLSIPEIRKRMDTLRQILIDEIDSEFYEIANEIFIDDRPGTLHCSVPLWLDQQYTLLLAPLTNNPRKLIRTYFPNALQEMVKRGIFTPCDFSPESVLYILNEYNKVLISINRIHHARNKGEFAYEKQFESNQIIPVGEPQENPSTTPQKKILLSEFISLFIETKIKDGKWVRRSIADHRNRIEILLDVLGDIPVADIDRGKMRKFREVLRKLPPNRSKDKRFKGKSIEEIVAMNPDKTLSIGTIDTTLTTISGMFEWGIREELIDKNPAKDLGLSDPEQDIDKRDPLSEEDIKMIFFSGDYTPDKFRHPSYYWVPLIGLYTGMRLEEICQLHTEDIYQEDGIWVFDVRRESSDGLDDKILKNKNSARKVPIHTDLIELGLIGYLDKISKESVRLFPELNKTEKSPKYGKQIGKQFTALLKRKGIVGKKSFHSLRHSFSNYFKKLNLHTDIFTQVMGHKQEKLAAKRYGSRYTPQQCYEELISKIDFS